MTAKKVKKKIEREWYTPPELSAESGIKLDNLMTWIRDGSLRAINTALDRNGQRPRWRVSKADWEAFLEARANKPPTPTAKAPRRRRKKAQSGNWV